ncbi:MAG: SurA N-terminal domain-containing protein [Pseudomonadota bacterium]
MLKSVRNALKGVVAWIVIALLVLSFAAFGVPEIRNFARNPALQVGDIAFSSNDIRNELNRQITNRRAEAEGAYSFQQAVQDGLANQVIQQMASRAALDQQAKALGLAMPRDLMRELLAEDERLIDPETGDFNATTLQSILQYYNMTVQQFESMMRSELLRNQLISSTSQGAPASKTLIEAFVLRDVETRDITYAIIDETLAEAAAEPSEDDLVSFHRANPAEFTAPEFRAFTFAALRTEDFEDKDSVSDERLREVYDANLERLYQTPEKRTLYQAQFDTEADANAAAADLRADKSFEEVAAARGLSLESVTFEDLEPDDVIDPTVREAAFAADLEPGDVAGPVKGLFGFTVIQVVDATPAETRAFDEVRDELRTALLESETRKLLYNAVEALENARDTGAGLTEAAKAAGVDAKRVGPVDSFSFGPGGEIIPDIPGDVLTEAFALDEGAESDAIEFEDDSGYFFVAVEEITPATLRPYEDVADAVKRAWSRADRDRRIADASRKLREAASGEGGLAAAAAVMGAKVETRTVDRGELGAPDISRALLEDAFLADVGDIIEGAASTTPARALVEVRAAAHDASRANPAQARVLQQYLSYQLDQELFEAYVSAVRDDLGVKTDERAIDAIVSEGG